MDLKQLRENSGVTQAQLVSMLFSQGVDVTVSEISRIENGAVERYGYIADRCAEVLGRSDFQAVPKKPTKTPCKLSKGALALYERLLKKGYIDYADAKYVLYTAYGRRFDNRGARKAISELREVYPVIEDPCGMGWSLAAAESDCERQLRIYESKKRKLSRQEVPLIVMRKELKKGVSR